ncbi:hypothetical protein [Rhizocola hellebori]|uniref:hypothetical protein n=1 Tax=Rhizocola hellebori TaxID=1392758 RepID=UPI0019435AC1|nr:hypothetical protein [Rhizocola hellebori]
MKRRLLRILCTVVALLSLDSAIGSWSAGAARPELFVTRPDSGAALRLLVVFPGYRMPGAMLSEAFGAHLGPSDAMIVVGHSVHGVDVELTFREVLHAIETIDPPVGALRVYGGSMGGMSAVDFLRRYQRAGAGYGRVTLFLDTAPSSPATVARPLWAVPAVSWFRGGPAVNALVHMVPGTVGPADMEPSADPDLVAAAGRAGRRYPLSALLGQASYIASFQPPSPAELACVDRAYFLHGRDPQLDPIIIIDGALAGWRQVLPQLQEVVIEGRAGQWHLPLIERPQETMAILSNFADSRPPYPGERSAEGGQAGTGQREERGEEHDARQQAVVDKRAHGRLTAAG